jgi:hypothetical protein
MKFLKDLFPVGIIVGGIYAIGWLGMKVADGISATN